MHFLESIEIVVFSDKNKTGLFFLTSSHVPYMHCKLLISPSLTISLTWANAFVSKDNTLLLNQQSFLFLNSGQTMPYSKSFSIRLSLPRSSNNHVRLPHQPWLSRASVFSLPCDGPSGWAWRRAGQAGDVILPGVSRRQEWGFRSSQGSDWAHLNCIKASELHTQTLADKLYYALKYTWLLSLPHPKNTPVSLSVILRYLQSVSHTNMLHPIPSHAYQSKPVSHPDQSKSMLLYTPNNSSTKYTKSTTLHSKSALHGVIWMKT